ncbi:DUF6214 family protein [Streptomyces sp. NPDC001889]
MLIVQETGFLNTNDQYDPGESLPSPPVWEVQGHGAVTVTGSALPAPGAPPPWFDVRLTFADGARFDVVAVVTEGRLAIEELRADPPLPLPGLAVLAARIGEPLEDACRTAAAPGPVWQGPDPFAATARPAAPPVPALPVPAAAEPAGPPSASRRRGRGRSTAPRGRAGRRIAADAYRAAQREGSDPVLAVMGATGRSRRRSLRLIAGARDEGYLAPRHNRR